MGQRITLAGGRVVTLKTTQKKIKGAPWSKRPGANNGPARQRYWASGRLMKRKVKALMVHCGLTRAEAEAQWLATRTRRKGGKQVY